MDQVRRFPQAGAGWNKNRARGPTHAGRELEILDRRLSSNLSEPKRVVAFYNHRGTGAAHQCEGTPSTYLHVAKLPFRLRHAPDLGNVHRLALPKEAGETGRTTLRKLVKRGYRVVTWRTRSNWMRWRWRDLFRSHPGRLYIARPAARPIQGMPSGRKGQERAHLKMASKPVEVVARLGRTRLPIAGLIESSLGGGGSKWSIPHESSMEDESVPGNRIRNASHHGNMRFNPESGYITYRLKKGGGVRYLKYAEYLMLCNKIVQTVPIQTIAHNTDVPLSGKIVLKRTWRSDTLH